MATGRKAFALGFTAIALSALFAACESSSSDPGPGGGDAGADTAGTSSGASSAGGSSAAGQAPDAQAGSDSSEPVGGTGSAAGSGPSANAGEPGSAGHPNAAGGSGSGELPNGGPECMSDHDCAVFNDCCECDVGAADEPHPACEKLCIQSACDARGIQAEARCQSNRCVFDLSCNRAEVTCKAAEPECPAGQVASVVDACWGPCIEVAQCRMVSDCDACPAGTACVRDDNSPGRFYQCVEVEAACAAKPTCECVDACFFSCGEIDEGVSCYCPFC